MYRQMSGGQREAVFLEKAAQIIVPYGCHASQYSPAID